MGISHSHLTREEDQDVTSLHGHVVDHGEIDRRRPLTG